MPSIFPSSPSSNTNRFPRSAALRTLECLILRERLKLDALDPQYRIPRWQIIAREFDMCLRRPSDRSSSISTLVISILSFYQAHLRWSIIIVIIEQRPLILFPKEIEIVSSTLTCAGTCAMQFVECIWLYQKPIPTYERISHGDKTAVHA